MKTLTKIMTQHVTLTRDLGPNYAFVFSDDLEKWMHSPKVSHAEKQRQADRRKAKWK